jgi:hypothetical protein
MFELPHPTSLADPGASPARRTNGAAGRPPAACSAPVWSAVPVRVVPMWKADLLTRWEKGRRGRCPGFSSCRPSPRTGFRRRAILDAILARSRRDAPPSLRRSKFDLVYDTMWADHNCLMMSDPVRDNFEVIPTTGLEQAPVDPDMFLCDAGELHGIFAVALRLERRFVTSGKPSLA